MIAFIMIPQKSLLQGDRKNFDPQLLRASDHRKLEERAAALRSSSLKLTVQLVIQLEPPTDFQPHRRWSNVEADPKTLITKTD